MYVHISTVRVDTASREGDMATRTLDRVGSEPLWQQLQRELLTRLNAGEFRIEAGVGEVGLQ